jgi:hypothetical protein
MRSPQGAVSLLSPPSLHFTVRVAISTVFMVILQIVAVANEPFQGCRKFVKWELAGSYYYWEISWFQSTRTCLRWP